jgi:sigma-54 specific flagellar transcriptional regulator A
VGYKARVNFRGGDVKRSGDRNPASSARTAFAVDEPASVRYPSGPSAAIRQVVTLIRKVASHDSNVLVLGESGTGKEVVARAVHESSPRRHGAFVAVNCGAIPAELMESELFGHEKGAFTGAYASRRGRFEIAEGGTLFLDEIGDMSPPMQVKLLRVLQERVFERVGNHQPIRCDVRIIAATHRNIEEAIEQGQFRGDLFYRLNVFPIEMPSLRERADDLDALVHEFALANVRAGRPMLEFSTSAMQALRAYLWPGNVRELGNLVERLSVLNGEQRVEVMDLPPRYREGFSDPKSPLVPEIVGCPDAAISEAVSEAVVERTVIQRSLREALAERLESQRVIADTAADPAGQFDDYVEPDTEGLPADGVDLRAHLYAIEHRLISEALERSGGTVAHAARLLSLRRTTLVEKLRKFGMAESENCQG